jgi:hypothetical protein
VSAHSQPGSGDVEGIADIHARIEVETGQQPPTRWRRIAELVPARCPEDGCAIDLVCAVGAAGTAAHVCVTYGCGHRVNVAQPAGATLGVERAA